MNPLEAQAKANSSEIKKLRDEIHYKKKLISAYQSSVKAHKLSQGGGVTSTFRKTGEHKSADARKVQGKIEE